MIFLGCNAAGLLNKVDSLKRNIQNFMPGAVFIQESKAKRKNKLKLDGYVIFEKLRKDACGGGLLTAVHRNLDPVSVGDGNEEVEVLVVEAKLQSKKVRLINAYGPQEDEIEDQRKYFFNKLDEEVKSAKLSGAMVCLEMDANSKLGSEWIPNDPHPQSKNGKLLENLLIENDLVVVNGMDLCKGTITRFRKTINRVEKSVLDFFIVCKRFLAMITKLVIDEERKFTLTKFSSKRGQKVIKESDHNVMILEMDLRWSSVDKPQRLEIFNLKSKDDFKEFQKKTEKNDELVRCFENFTDFNSACNMWLKTFNNIIRKSFKKIRISRTKNPAELDELFSKKESVKQKMDEAEKGNDINLQINLENEYDDVVQKMAVICAKRNKEIVEEYLGKDNDADDEPHNQLKTWRLKKRLAPKNVEEAPAAKVDKNGVLITEKAELEKLYLETYIDRLKQNDVPEDLKDIVKLKNLLFGLRMNMCGKVKSADWTMSDLDKVLKKLKNNKARDAHGHTYELFKYGGNELKISLLKMFNLTKSLQVYPDILQPSNISSIYKLKGRKDDLNSDRGVFNVVKLRSIMDRLSYNDNYCIIDQNMSCSNIGARKNRNIRDHLFVINGILNEVNSQKNRKVDIQIVDIKKCFDKMSYKETANDLFNAGVKNDHFVLMAKSNEKCQVAVRTPWGSVTDRVELNEIEMQGTVPAPLKCSIQMDTLGKECIESGECLFKYKECVDIPPLAMIDDILAVSECSVESVKLNAIIQSKVAHKNLELGPDKCFKLHVGKKSECCPTLKIGYADMLSSSKEKYLGDILTTDGRINANIEERCNKGIGIVNQILSLLKEITFGQYYFEMAVLFRQSMLLSSILCNSEVLYGVNGGHIDSLEAVDNYFWRRVFRCPVTTPIETFFLESNCVQIRFILISRRLMYYWNILNMDKSELVSRVYSAQKLSSCRNDWVLKVSEDLKTCSIDLTENQIMNMKKTSFRKLVRKKVREASESHLILMKKSKSVNIFPSDVMKLYLKTNMLSTEEKQLLFLMRVRMNDVKSNYSNKYKNNPDCSLCHQNVKESEVHLLKCLEIVSEPDINLENVKYSDIYGNLGQQIRAAKTWKKIFKIKNWKLQNRSLSDRPQAHQLSASYHCDDPLAVDPPPGISTALPLSLVYDPGY